MRNNKDAIIFYAFCCLGIWGRFGWAVVVQELSGGRCPLVAELESVKILGARWVAISFHVTSELSMQLLCVDSEGSWIAARSSLPARKTHRLLQDGEQQHLHILLAISKSPVNSTLDKEWQSLSRRGHEMGHIAKTSLENLPNLLKWSLLI